MNLPLPRSSEQCARFLDRVGVLLPHRTALTSRVFLNLRPGMGGPSTFAGKLSREFARRDVRVAYRDLAPGSAALLFSVSWGDWFHKLCQRRGVRTALRVDGFMIPVYFDNRPQCEGFQDRRLTLDHMALNYRLQGDLAMSDFVIYQSEFSRRMADRYLYKRRANQAVIHNGVDLQHFVPAGKHKGRIRLAVAGTLRDEYMLGTVLPVFRRLWRRFDLELLIVGAMDDICRKQINDVFRLFTEISERIWVVGAVPNNEVPQYLQQADILVHPRLGDGCPNVVIEAMACGLPVACGSWGGTAELVGDGGVVVTTGEWTYGEEYEADLASAVECILGDLDGYRVRARKRAEQVFDIREIAGRYLNALGIQSA